MKKVYNIDLSSSGIRELQNGLKDYQKWIERKTDELAKKLADIGAVKASLEFSRAIYTGNEDHTIEVVPIEPNCYAVKATGETVLFVEFGSGLIGYGHPEADGYGREHIRAKGIGMIPKVGGYRERKTVGIHSTPMVTHRICPCTIPSKTLSGNLNEWQERCFQHD